MAALGWLMNLGFAGGEPAAIAPTVPGLGWTLDETRPHWTLDETRAHWTLEENRAHWTLDKD